MYEDLRSLLRGVSKSHHHRAHTYLIKEGITQGQPRILDYLWEHDGSIQREIAESCHLEPATITSIIFNMEKAGMVERRQNPADRRVVCVWLTNKGREARKTTKKIFDMIEKESFEGFQEQEIKQMKDLLKRMLDNIRNAEK